MEVIIALKRGTRAAAPVNWVDIVAQTPGVELQGEPLYDRISAEASEDAITQLQERLGDFVHVEPVIRYRTSDTDGMGP